MKLRAEAKQKKLEEKAKIREELRQKKELLKLEKKKRIKKQSEEARIFKKRKLLGKDTSSQLMRKWISTLESKAIEDKLRDDIRPNSDGNVDDQSVSSDLVLPTWVSRENWEEKTFATNML